MTLQQAERAAQALIARLLPALPVRAAGCCLREVSLEDALEEYCQIAPYAQLSELLVLAHAAGVQPRRAANAVRDRVALYAAMRELFSEAPVRFSSELGLSYTELGGPKVVWEGRMVPWARQRGVTLDDLHVSYTHDGGAHICLLAHGEGLRGLGVDLVHLPRLRRPGKDRDYLIRFARQFMGTEELAAWEAAAADEGDEALRERTAAHFSLMEAASKALGTGLKIGGGMGRPTSLPKRSISVAGLAPVRFQLTDEAVARIRELSAETLAGYWAADAEYLLSAAILS